MVETKFNLNAVFDVASEGSEQELRKSSVVCNNHCGRIHGPNWRGFLPRAIVAARSSKINMKARLYPFETSLLQVSHKKATLGT